MCEVGMIPSCWLVEGYMSSFIGTAIAPTAETVMANFRRSSPGPARESERGYM